MLTVCSCGRYAMHGRSLCRLCYAAQRRARYAADPELREKTRAYQAAWRKRHAARLREMRRRWAA